MQNKRSRKSALLLVLVAVLLLSLPLVAAAQTGGTTGTGSGSASGSSASATSAASGVGVTSNGLAAPREGQAISGQFVVRGFASDPNFMKWQLDLLPGGNADQATFLALGETSGVFTYTLNTTNLPAGKHALRLRVVRNDSNYTEYMTNFTIGGAGSTGGRGTGSGATGSTSGTSTTGGTGSTGATGSTSGTSTTGGTGSTGTSGGKGAGSTGATSGIGVTTNGLAAPREGQAISGQFVVRGFASDPNFWKWQLDLLPNGDATKATFLALGETSGVFTYTLGAASLPAGQHALRLRVVRNDAQYTEYTTNFTIGGASGAKGGASGASGSKSGSGTGTAGSAGATGSTGGAGTTGSGSGTGTGTGSGSGSSSGSTGAGGGAGMGVTTNGLAAPTEGQTIRGMFTVQGLASDPNFMKWQLDLLPNGNADQAAFLALGTTAGKFTYTLDTTNLPAGKHALRLRVVRSDSQYTEYFTNFTIAK